MEISLEILIMLTALTGGMAFVVGSMISPHNKVYKDEIKHWRSRCGTLEREAKKTDGVVDDFSGILELLPPELMNQLGGAGGMKGVGMLMKLLPTFLNGLKQPQGNPAPQQINTNQMLG